MSELISRQAAIEDIRTMIPKDARLDIKWIEMWLMQLPSAQPDFSCDGCQTPEHICGICMRNYPNITDHYCTGEWAERRTDEAD